MELIDTDRAARTFVEAHHYSASYPAARLRVGLYRVYPFTAPKLMGVAVFSEPCQRRTIPTWLGVDASRGVELGRFVLLDEVEGNGESWFLARALRLLREAKPQIERVVSYSDPMERCSSAGHLIKPGHVGIIYQASNARFLGRSGSRTELLDASGRVFSGRALSKIRSGERGASGAEARLVAAGAPKRRRHEEGVAYVKRALAEGGFVARRHPGKIVYAFGLDKAARRALPPNPNDYPKEGLL
ncbi:MAG: hypothetical protein KKH12_16235 [Gammaproteobacteria bacterium]|nr:hypothetical protein [Gammaproteobacteria bacterium]